MPVGDGGGDDDDDENDHEDLDTQAALGEQSFDEEKAQAERQHQDDDSEVEERAFKLKVTAVVRLASKAKRYDLASASIGEYFGSGKRFAIRIEHLDVE